MPRSLPVLPAILPGVLVTIAGLALAVPAWVVTHAPAVHPAPRLVRMPRRVVPPAELPPVEPLRLVDLSLDDARTYNAGVPFSAEPNPAARPFRFAGDVDSLARATDCLAAAVIYEAGDDAVGERAVAQVILNRLRHPAFPKTVCGVVFEGSERTTGCQFTFTCDGALTRWHPTEAGWRRAREVAGLALAGSVYRPIGYSTHYHTDWVVPYWQASLDKVAAVHTHLFFRWTGWWGTPPAFNRIALRSEPVVAKLAVLSDAHRLGVPLLGADAALAETAAATTTAPAPLTSDGNSFLVTLPRGSVPELYPALAAQACGDRPYCKYSGWADAAKTPAALPLEPQQIAGMTFSYLRDRAAGVEKSLWNCQQVRRAIPAQCMKVQVYMTALPAPAAGATPLPAATKGPVELGGVRRKAQPAPAPSPVPPIARAPVRAPARAPVTPPGTSPAAAP